MRVGLALIVVVTNIIAITSVLGARMKTGRRLVWILAIVLLPLAGSLVWLTGGRR